MDFKKLRTLITILLIGSSLSYSQTNKLQHKLDPISAKLLFKSQSNIPSFLKFKPSNQPSFEGFMPWFKNAMELHESFELKLLTQETDQIGFTHYRYQQLYNSLPVENTMYLVHVKNGKVVSMNGLLYDNFNASNVSSLSETDALKNAMVYTNAKVYMWDDPMSEQLIKFQNKNMYATWYPKGEMVYVASDYATDAKQYKLAYKFDIYAAEPMSRQYVFVDAQLGDVIAHLDRINTSDTPVTAKTAMSGTQSIVADYYAANSFRLRETKRGNGVATYNLKKGTSYGSAVDFTDSDTLWDNVNSNWDEYATDAHFGAEMTYDYFKNIHNRNSIDGSGFNLISYIHYSNNYSNAFWNGSYMTYGDGNGSNVKPLVSLDITGHEITHGLTSNTAQLNYSYESGALNESFSDCLGTAIEWYGDSAKFEWDLATKIGWTIRSLGNPNAHNQPDTYYGQYWYTGAADNGGVHTNSGVQNFWFYLLSVGGTGTNDNNDTYSVDSIGIHEAAAITFRTLTYYLYSSAQYDDARTYSLQASEDLFGSCSSEEFAVAAAWHAVGIGSNLEVYTASTLTQNVQDIAPGTNNNVILRINVKPACNAIDTAFKFNFNTNGTSNVADILRAKLYYTGVGTTFNTLTKFGITVTAPSGAFSFTGNQELANNSDNYFWLVYDIDSFANVGDSLDAECTSIILDTVVTPTITAPAGCRQINYCIPTVTYGCYSGGMCISNIEVSNLANNTGSSCNAKAYNNYTNKIAKFEQGITYNTAVAVTTYSAYINIWIDLDDDGNFNNTNEQLLNKYLVSANTTGNTSITIPSGAAVGYHRMRVRHQYAYSYISLDACADGYNGEIEDYTAQVMAQSNMVYNASNVFQITPNVSRGSSDNHIIGIKVDAWGSLNPLKLNALYLNTTGTTNMADVAKAKVYYTGTSSVFATTTQVGSTVSAPGTNVSFNDSVVLSSGYNYFWFAYDVTATATLGDLLDAGADSFVIAGTTYTADTVNPYGSRKIYYCLPNTASYACVYMYINNVKLDSINNNSGCSSTSFSDFTSLSTTISQGDVVNYSVSLYQYNMYVTIWVDFNNNGLFDASEQVVANQLSTGFKAAGTFAVPINTSVGQHLVRIACDYYTNVNDPCKALAYGETEDYMLNVDTAKSMNYISSATTQNSINVSKNSGNNHIIGIKINTVGASNPLPIKSFKLNSTGTTDTSEIRNAKLWYTGSSPVFATTTQFGSTVTYPGNKFTINDSMVLTSSGYNYFWLTYDIPSYAKLTNHVDAGCDSIAIANSTYAPDTNNPSGDREIYYCVPPTSTYPCYMYISNVVLDSINITSGCSSTSYSDFTNISSATTTNQGEFVKYSITSYLYDQYINIWLDANDDGMFDSTERVVANQLTTSLKAVGSFIVPVATPVGKHQVRIKAEYYTSYANSACSQFIYGETEDYIIKVDTAKRQSYISANNIQNKKAVQPNTANNDVIHIIINTKGAASPLYAKSFTIYATGTTNTNDISNARIWYTGSDSNYNTTKQFGSTISSLGSSALTFADSLYLQGGPNYFWISYDVVASAKLGNYIDATCTAFMLNSTSHAPDTAAPYGNRKIDYCIPTGGAINYYNATYQWGITKVDLNNLSKSSGVPTTTATYYTDYTAYSASLVAGSNYSLYVTPGSTAATYPQATVAWVDWNANGVFDSVEEIGRNLYHKSVDTVKFTVPSSQAAGSYRLRIMSGYYYYFYTGACKFNPCFVANSNAFDVGECEDYTIDIVSPPNPVISPNSNIAFCIGSGQQFTTAYDTGYTYNWYKNGSTLLKSGKGHPYDSLYYSPSAAGTDSITVKVTDSYSQTTTSAAVAVIISSKAVGGTAGLSASYICTGDSVSLTLSGSAGNIIWQYLSAGAWTSTGSSANPYKVAPANTTTYRAYLSSGTCPNDSSNKIIVTVSPKAVGGTASISANTICNGDSVDLSLTNSAGKIDWQYYNGANWMSMAISSNPYRIIPSGTVTLRAYVTSGVCNPDSSNQVTVTVNPKPVAGNISASATICIGDSVNLILSNNTGTISWQSYVGSTWQNLGLSANSIYVSPTANTDYRALVTAGSCGTDTSKTVSIKVTPPAVAGSIFASVSKICLGDSAFMALTGNTGSVAWQYDNGSGWQNLNSSANNIYVSPTTATSYRAVITSGNCGSDTSKVLAISMNPKAVAGSASSSIAAICPGDSASLSVAGSTGTISWLYYNGTQWVTVGNSSSGFKVSPSSKTNYRVVVSTVCGMDSSNIVSVDVYPTPAAVITPGGPKDLCNGDSIILSAGNAASYNWSTGVNSPTISLKQTATVSVTLKDMNGCSATSLNNTYTFHTPATPIIAQSGDSLIASPKGAVSYIWKLAGSIVSTTLVNYYIPAQKGFYTVEYTDNFGCLSVSSVAYNYNNIGIANIYNTPTLRVWPNPSNDGTFNIIATVNTSRASLRITDMTGRLLMQESQAITNNSLNTSLDLSKFAHGLYLLYIETDGGKSSVPVKLVRE